MNGLRNKRLFLLDMDGTIYLDDKLFDGTTDFLQYIRQIGGKYVFLTNNSSKSVEKYIEKLAKLGIASQKDDFLTSADATIVCLKKKKYKKIYAFGTTSFRKQLSDECLNITTEQEEDIDCLCMGFDTELTFKKLEDSCMLLNKGVDYVATNPDWVCPTRYGSVPDCGSVAAMLCNATGRKPLFIGKPQPEMALLAMEKYGYTKDETVIIGDRLYTDIACGVNAGISSVFVLSGEGVMSDIEKYKINPDYIYENILKLYNDLKRGEQENVGDNGYNRGFQK